MHEVFLKFKASSNEDVPHLLTPPKPQSFGIDSVLFSKPSKVNEKGSPFVVAPLGNHNCFSQDIHQRQGIIAIGEDRKVGMSILN